MTDKWDDRFLDLAEFVAGWSKDPNCKVGAVIARPDNIVASIGFNGFPKGTSDAPELYLDRDIKHARVVHAEVNAILHARESVSGCTIYTSPRHPCAQCAGQIIQAGITRVVFSQPQGNSEWADSHAQAQAMFLEAGIWIEEAQ